MNPRQSEIGQIKQFVLNALRNKIFSALLISGYPGCGKTYSILEALQNIPHQYWNCINNKAPTIRQCSSPIQVIDEIDRADSAFNNIIRQFQQQGKCLIMACNRFDLKLEFKYQSLQFAQYDSVQLLQIAKSQKSNCDDRALQYICQQIEKQNSDARLLRRYLADPTFAGYKKTQEPTVVLNGYQARILKILTKPMQIYQIEQEYRKQYDEDPVGTKISLDKMETLCLVMCKKNIYSINNSRLNRIQEYIDQLVTDML